MEQYKFDMYAALEVSRNASPAEIKEAYLKLAKRVHPDRTASLPNLEKKISNETMYRVNYAYSVLCDPIKRIKYDIATDLINSAQSPLYQLVNKLTDDRLEKLKNSQNVEEILRTGKEVVDSIINMINGYASSMRDLRVTEEDGKKKEPDKKA